MKLNRSDTHKPMRGSWENWHTRTRLLSVSVHWNLSQKHTQNRLDVYNGRPWSKLGFSVGRWATLSSANVSWSVCGLCFRPGWAIKAPKGCRNIMSSQQGQILNGKSSSCTRAHFPDLFLHTNWNVTLFTNSVHTHFILFSVFLISFFPLSALSLSGGVDESCLVGSVEVNLGD